jgi:hypothetical protein
MAATFPPKKGFSPIVGLFGAWLLFIALDTVGGYMLVAADGTVVASEVRNTPRRSVVYTMRGPTGESFTYTSGPTDGDLHPDLPIGSHVIKRKWALDYSLDGQRIANFPMIFYGILSGIGASLICLSAILLIHKWRYGV